MLEMLVLIKFRKLQCTKCGLDNIFLIVFSADDKAPSITGCPNHINVNLPQGNSDVVVTWNEPSTSETVGISRNETHQPGSRFTNGVSTVQYIFTDQAGNSAICTFNVTVSGE